MNGMSQPAAPREVEGWIATWTTGPAGAPPGEAPRFRDQTLRAVIRTSAGGARCRVRLSNVFGTTPLVVGAVGLARRRCGAQIDPATRRRVTFGGAARVAIPAGAEAVSDPVALEVPPLADLAISLWLPEPTEALTMHLQALQTSYLARGDATSAPELSGAEPTTAWHFLTGVDVWLPGGATIVTFGDSITDGANSTPDQNRRWPDVLAARLQERPATRRLGVVNQGIIGNRILHDSTPQYGNLFGPAALARFDRDVLEQPGVACAIVLLGINDIGHPGPTAPLGDAVSAEAIQAGLLQLVERAHQRGVRIFGSTLTPFEGTADGYYSPEKEAKRQAVNHWIRTAGRFDGVFDLDAAVRDPEHPARLASEYDAGDHLHPSDAGMSAIGRAIPLEPFDSLSPR
jgi:lysophospholipase L1-like esterase